MLFINSVSAQSFNDILGAAGINVSNYQKAKRKYTPGENFPSKGYDLSMVSLYHGLSSCTIERFPDVDTLYYMKAVKNGMKERTFYFMIINQEDVDIILNNSLNKEQQKSKDRIRWMNSFLDKTQVDNADDKSNPYWTFHKTKAAFSSDKYVVEGTVRGMGYKLLDSETAKKEYYNQRGMDKNGNKIDYAARFVTALVVMKAMGYLSPSGKYYCNGLEFNSYADMEDYKNAQGLK